MGCSIGSAPCLVWVFCSVVDGARQRCVVVVIIAVAAARGIGVGIHSAACFEGPTTTSVFKQADIKNTRDVLATLKIILERDDPRFFICRMILRFGGTVKKLMSR